MTDFDQLFDKTAEIARERFEREGFCDHSVYLFSLASGEPRLQEVPFDAILGAMSGGHIDARKERTYKAIASMMIQRDLPGYIEVSEIWVTTFRDQDVFEHYNQIIKKYGSVGNTPGRIEMLMVSGRYGRESKIQTWKIGRRGNEVWLEHGLDGFTLGGGSSKVSSLDRASEKLTGFTESK